MFNNLIESSSHKNEIKRRGSFLLFTSITYALLFAIAGVASIFAYDATLNEQNLEIVTMVPVEVLAPEQPAQPDRPATPRSEDEAASDQEVFRRRVAMADTNRPEVMPDSISAKPNQDLPMPERGIVILGPTNSNPGGGRSSASDNNGGGSREINPVVVTTEPPPTPPEPKPAQQVLIKKVINSEAISLPVPRYPQIARDARIQGVVLIQVLIDESGKVVSAQVVRGNPMLVGAAKQAAYMARFSPTRIGDQAVKVSGTITYNFEIR